MNETCLNCGLLCFQHKTQRHFVSAEHEWRISDIRPRRTIPASALNDFQGPMCHERHWEFPEDEATREGELQQSRETCPDYVVFRRGFDPKEHLEMGLIAEDRAWREKQADKQEQFQQAQATVAETRHKESLKQARYVPLLIAAISFAAGIALAVLSNYLNNG